MAQVYEQVLRANCRSSELGFVLLMRQVGAFRVLFCLLIFVRDRRLSSKTKRPITAAEQDFFDTMEFNIRRKQVTIKKKNVKREGSCSVRVLQQYLKRIDWVERAPGISCVHASLISVNGRQGTRSTIRDALLNPSSMSSSSVALVPQPRGCTSLARVYVIGNTERLFGYIFFVAYLVGVTWGVVR